MLSPTSGKVPSVWVQPVSRHASERTSEIEEVGQVEAGELEEGVSRAGTTAAKQLGAGLVVAGNNRRGRQLGELIRHHAGRGAVMYFSLLAIHLFGEPMPP